MTHDEARDEPMVQRADFFAHAVGALPTIVYVYDLAAERVVFANGMFEQALGYSWAQLQAFGAEMLPRLMHPDDLARGRTHLERVADLPDGAHALNEYRMRDIAGHWCWFESRDAVFSRHADGRAREIVGTAAEIGVRKDAELSLIRTESMLRRQFEGAPMAVIECDPELRVTRWAGEAERMFGWRADEVLGRPIGALRMAHADDRDDVRRVVAPLLAGQVQQVISSNRNVAKDGRVLHCTWHNSRVAASDGSGETLVSLVLDVTERRRAEEALRASEERHRLLAQTMLQGVVHQAADGRIIAMNPAATRILGKGPTAFIGSDSVREAHDTIREDGSLYPGNEHPSMVALRCGEPVRGVVMGIWNPRLGQRRWIRIDAVPVFHPGHRSPAEVYAVFEDITESRGHHEALRLASARFELALQGARIIVSTQDLDLRYTWVYSPERPRRGEEFVGRFDADIAERPQDAVLTESLKREVIATGVAQRHEVALQYLGREHEFDLLVEPLRDENGRIGGVNAVAIDITERKHAERALREADRRKDIFIATLAHELRNPLAPILHAANALRAGAPVDAAVAHCSAVIERQVLQMARLLDDLLDVSRTASGRLLLRREPILLGTVIDEAVETARPLIQAAGHALAIHLPADPITLAGDRVRLAQVCANLLTNAAKYTPPQGRIELHARRDGDTVEIRVRDSGIGLAREHLDSVFEMFGQVDESLGRSQGGLGIGLALARGLVELHGGSIGAHSEGPGRGSEFVVRLPAPREMVPPARPATSGPAVRPARLRVLVVDDNRDAADTLAMLLGLGGHAVQMARDGVEALACAATHRPDVALLDIGLPGMSGFELCSALRRQPGGPAMLIVAISGWGQPQDRQRSAEAGFDAHFVKPVRFDELEALLAARR